MTQESTESPFQFTSQASRAPLRCAFAAFTLFFALVSACSQVPSSKSTQEIPVDSKAPGEFRVQVDAMTKLSDGQVAATKAESLLPDVRQLLSQGRISSARQIIARRPDMALETLRSQLGNDGDRDATRVIAITYDEQMHLPAGSGWASLVEPSHYAAVQTYSQVRRRMLEALQQGAPAEKWTVELSRAASASQSPMLQLDQLYLTGLMSLLTNRPGDAARTFEEACQQSVGIDPYQESQLALLLSDALRRCGETELANRTWERGVRQCSSLALERGVFDPVYWDRASYLRPVSMSWPSEALGALATRAGLDFPISVEQAGNGEAEAVVWAAIAHGLLDRGEHQAALVAAKRAEVATADAELRGWIRLIQAESLACLEQGPAATAVLVSLTMSRDSRLADAATATLGGMKLQSGDTNSGFRLLVKALKQKSPPEWQGRAKAEADLGLAYLMRNDETNGMNWLHSAQSRFANQGDVVSLSQSLWNESAYMKQAKRKSAEIAVQDRLAALEASKQPTR